MRSLSLADTGLPQRSWRALGHAQAPKLLGVLRYEDSRRGHRRGVAFGDEQNDQHDHYWPTGRTRIWFIRHGESEANRNLHLVSGRSNYTPLSPAGREQAQALGVALLDCDYLPDAIYTSPALRTVTTADLALRAMGITDSAQPDDRLQELDQGRWTGLSGTRSIP